MEVILLEDVKSLGKKGQIVKVNDGYARNFILKKNLGLEANSKNAKKQAEELKEASVTVKLKTGAGGKTFGSISAKEIAVAAKEQLNMEIDKKKLVLQEAIKSLGCHIVQLKLHPEVTAELTVKVVEE